MQLRRLMLAVELLGPDPLVSVFISICDKLILLSNACSNILQPMMASSMLTKPGQCMRFALQRYVLVYNICLLQLWDDSKTFKSASIFISLCDLIYNTKLYIRDVRNYCMKSKLFSVYHCKAVSGPNQPHPSSTHHQKICYSQIQITKLLTFCTLCAHVKSFH